MRTTYEFQAGILIAEMIERETAEETSEFVRGLLAALRERGGNRVLISVRNSRPLFKVEDWRLSAAMDEIKAIPAFRVAFIADAREINMSQEYICVLLRQRSIEGRVFADKSEALAWLGEAR